VFDIDTSQKGERVLDGTDWRAFARNFLATFGGTLVLLYIFILTLDPFGSGRFPALPIYGVVDEDPRTANVFRARDSHFDSAIIGNSTGQLLSPARFLKANGPKFVQLTIPGSGPREQLTIWHWFVEHHNAMNAIVLVADQTWCSGDAALPIRHPFPFWLYADGWIDYALNIFSTHALDRAFRRLTLAAGLRRASDSTGYSDYELGRVASFNPQIPAFEPATPSDDGARPSFPAAGAPFVFPAITLLEQAIGTLPPTVAVIVVTPPVFFTDLPRTGTSDATRASRCKNNLAQTVAGRPRSGFIDLFRNIPLAHDPNNFMDAIHYRASVARQIEAQVSETLAGQNTDQP
jgi:hypothetical protein